MANNEKVTGPGHGYVGITSVVLLTIATWVLLWTLHVRLWSDPINPMTPNERSTVTHKVPAHQQQTADIP
jgi:hypothetical protein